MNELCQNKQHSVVCYTCRTILQLITAQAKPYTQCCLQSGKPYVKPKSQRAIYLSFFLFATRKRPGHNSSMTTHNQIRKMRKRGKGDATIMLTQPELRLQLTLLIKGKPVSLACQLKSDRGSSGEVRFATQSNCSRTTSIVLEDRQC